MAEAEPEWEEPEEAEEPEIAELEPDPGEVEADGDPGATPGAMPVIAEAVADPEAITVGTEPAPVPVKTGTTAVESTGISVKVEEQFRYPGEEAVIDPGESVKVPAAGGMGI